MSGSREWNNLDRVGQRTAPEKDSRRNLQQMLRRQYQQSRGSPESASNSENLSPVEEPVSFRPPVRREEKKINITPPAGASGRSESPEPNGNFVFENNFETLSQNDDVVTQKGQGQITGKNQGQKPSQSQRPSQGQMSSKGYSQGQMLQKDQSQGKMKQKGEGGKQPKQTAQGQFDDVLNTVIGEISSGSGQGARSGQARRGEEAVIFENNFDDVDQTAGSAVGASQHPSRGESAPIPYNMNRTREQIAKEKAERLQKLRQPRQGTQDSNDPFAVLASQLMPNKSQTENKDEDGDEKMADLFAPSMSRNTKSPEGYDQDHQLLQALKNQGDGKSKGDDPMAKLLESFGVAGTDGANSLSQMMEAFGSQVEGNGDVGDKGGVGKREEGVGADPLSQLMGGLGGMGRGKGGDGRGNIPLGGSGGSGMRRGQGGADPMSQMLGMMGGGRGAGGGVQGAIDPMSQMMGALGGRAGGGADPMSQMMGLLGGGGGAGGGAIDPMSQMMGALGGRGGGGADPMSQMMGALGGRGGGGADPMSQMMGALGGRAGGGADPMSQMMGMLGGGGGAGGGAIDPMSQMMGALGGRGGGGADPMSQMMAALGGGGRGGGPANPLSSMMGALGGGQGRGQGPQDPLAMFQQQAGAMRGQGRGGGGGGQFEDEEIDIENASLNDQLQQLLGYENIKAQTNKSPISDGMCTIIIIDTSGSMQGEPITEAGQFISQFLNGLEEVQFEYGQEENVAVICVGREVHVLQHLTTDYGAVRQAVDTVYADGPSPLHLALMLPLSVLVLDPRRNRDYIANTNGHRISPRVIVITDGHPSDKEDTPGQSIGESQQDSIDIQSVCVELMQTVRERTLCELYCVPVGEANIIQYLRQLLVICATDILKEKMADNCLARHMVKSISTADIVFAFNRKFASEEFKLLNKMGQGSQVNLEAKNFLTTLCESVGGSIKQTVDAKQMSRTFLHHFVVGNLINSGHDTTNRETVAQVVQQCLACSDDEDVTSVMKILAQGEPDVAVRDQALAAQMQQANPQSRGRGGGREMNQQQMMQALMGSGRGEGMGGARIGRGQPVTGQGHPPSVGGDGGNMEAMMQSLMAAGMGGGEGQGEKFIAGKGVSQQGGERSQLAELGGRRGGRNSLHALKRGNPKNAGGQMAGKGKQIIHNTNADDNKEAGNLNDQEQQLPPVDDNECLGWKTSGDHTVTKELVDALMPDTNKENTKNYWDQLVKSRPPPQTEEEKSQYKFDNVMQAESIGINEPYEEAKKDDDDGDDESERRTDAAEQDIMQSLKKVAKERKDSKKSADDMHTDQDDGEDDASFTDIRKLLGIGQPEEPRGHQQQVPSFDMGGDRGKVNVDLTGSYGSQGRVPFSHDPPKHNLPPDIADMMKLNQNASGGDAQPKHGYKGQSKPSQGHPKDVYQRDTRSDRTRKEKSENRADFNQVPSDANFNPQSAMRGLDGLGLVNVEDEEEDEASKSPDLSRKRNSPSNTTQYKKQTENTAAGSRRPGRPTKDRGSLHEMLQQRQQRPSRQAPMERQPRPSRQAPIQRETYPNIEDSDTD